jgi:hypothetical protein
MIKIKKRIILKQTYKNILFMKNIPNKKSNTLTKFKPNKNISLLTQKTT